MNKPTILTLLTLPVFFSTGSAATLALFDFFDEGGAVEQADNFDPGGVGAAIVGVDPNMVSTTVPLTLTVVDIIGQDGSSAASGAANTDHTLNIAGSQDALSINTDNTADDDFVTGGDDSSHFNPGESVVFSFDFEVNLVNVELESFTAGQTVFTVSSGGTTVNLSDSNNALTDFNIPAGTPFAFTFVSTSGADNQVRIESFTADIIPEPSSSLLLGLGALGLFARRRR